MELGEEITGNHPDKASGIPGETHWTYRTGNHPDKASGIPGGTHWTYRTLYRNKMDCSHSVNLNFDG